MKYKIEGEPMPVVICELDPGEQMFTEGGAMSWMSPNMQMETTSNGGLGKALGRSFAGERMFQNIYTAKGGPGMIACASGIPGRILPFEIAPGRELILQKGSFLIAEMGVTLEVHLRHKLKSGLFSGEGFIMQKVSGSGLIFAEIDGHVMEYELASGEQLVVSTGHLAAMTASCTLDVQTVAGMKNKLFGGEGFFSTVITGPGRVWLQTMPICNLAEAIRTYLPSSN